MVTATPCSPSCLPHFKQRSSSSIILGQRKDPLSTSPPIDAPLLRPGPFPLPFFNDHAASFGKGPRPILGPTCQRQFGRRGFGPIEVYSIRDGVSTRIENRTCPLWLPRQAEGRRRESNDRERRQKPKIGFSSAPIARSTDFGQGSFSITP